MIVLWGYNKKCIRPSSNLSIAWIFTLRIIAVTREYEILWIDKQYVNIRQLRTKIGNITRRLY
ncbi:hypothetical protein D9M68_943540 [compost metagenome]